MRTIKRWGLAGALAGTLAFGGCSATNSMLGRNQQTWSMASAQQVPAAKGKVEVGAEKNGNHDVKVEVEHLAKAGVAFEGKATYVVWLRPQAGRAQNVGVLNVDDKLKGELKTQTPFDAFEVIVTAEASPDVIRPSGPEVMNARVEVAT